MFRWLLKQFSSDEQATELLGSAKSLRALIADLSAAPPTGAIRTLSERFEEMERLRLTAPKDCRALQALDEYAQLRLGEVWELLLTEGRGQSISDAVWQLLVTYYRGVHRGYLLCLGVDHASAPPPDSEHGDAMIMASRAMGALARHMLLLRMRYRVPPKDVWSRVNDLVAWVERRNALSAPTERYPGVTTTIERELAAALLMEMAPTGNLLPAQIQALDHVLRQYAGYYTIADTYDEQIRPFIYEPSKNESPRRWLGDREPPRGARYFGIGGAYVELSKACDDARNAGRVPDWIGQTRCTADDYRDLLERLVAAWSQQPPSRRERREPCPGEILVAHDWSHMRRLVNFGELAKSGHSLLYDLSNAHSMSDSVLRGRSEIFRDFTTQEVSLANLRSFEQTLAADATDLWSLSDESENGIGATAAATCPWPRIGMIVALRRSESVKWEIAFIRRLNFTPNHRLAIGMTRVPGVVYAARLQFGVEAPDYSIALQPKDPLVEHDAIVTVEDGFRTLLLPIGVVDDAYKYTLYWNNRREIVKVERSLERGLNFERVEISEADMRV